MSSASALRRSPGKKARKPTKEASHKTLDTTNYVSLLKITIFLIQILKGFSHASIHKSTQQLFPWRCVEIIGSLMALPLFKRIIYI